MNRRDGRRQSPAFEDVDERVRQQRERRRRARRLREDMREVIIP